MQATSLCLFHAHNFYELLRSECGWEIVKILVINKLYRKKRVGLGQAVRVVHSCAEDHMFEPQQREKREEDVGGWGGLGNQELT
jgi:hypothetical protein